MNKNLMTPEDFPFPVVPSGKYRLGVVDQPDVFCAEGDAVKMKEYLVKNGYHISVPVYSRMFLFNVQTPDLKKYAMLYTYPYNSLGAALLESTGSHPFLVFLRARARKMGMGLRRDGLYYGDNKIHGRTEQGIFQALCLIFVPPTHRNVKGDWRTWKIPEWP